MALAQNSDASALKQLKYCLKGDNEGYQPAPATVGALACIAARLGHDINKNSWIGPAIALLSESLAVNEVDKILAERPGRYQAEWSKWKLAQIDYTWGNTTSKQGQDNIRNLMYNLLMEDLKKLYTGFTDDDGSEIGEKNPKEICESIETDIGFVLKTTYLREKLVVWGVPLRNQSGQPSVRVRSQTESAGSPSTIGPSTPIALITTTSSTLPVFTARKPGGNYISAAHNQSTSEPVTLEILASCPAPPSGHGHDETFPISNPTYLIPETNSFFPAFDDPLDSIGKDVFTTGSAQQFPSSLSFISTHKKGVSSDLSMKDVPEMWVQPNVADTMATIPDLDRPPAIDSYLTSHPTQSSMPPPVPDSSLSYSSISCSNDILLQLAETVGVLTERLNEERTARIKLESKVAESYARIGQCETAYMTLGKDYHELSLAFSKISQKLEQLDKRYDAVESDRDNEREARDSLESRHYVLYDQLKRLQITTGDLASRTTSMEVDNQVTIFTTTNLKTTLDELGTKFTKLCRHGWTIKTGLDRTKLKQNSLEAVLDTLKDKNAEVEEKLIELEKKNNTFHSNLQDTRQQTNILGRQAQALEDKTTKIEKKSKELHCSIQALQKNNNSFQDTITSIQGIEEALHEQISTLQMEHDDLKNKIKKAEDRFSVSSLDSGLGRSPRNSLELLPGPEPLPTPKRQWSETSSTGKVDKKRTRVHDGIETNIDLAGQERGDESPILGSFNVPFCDEACASQGNSEDYSGSSFLEDEMADQGDENFYD